MNTWIFQSNPRVFDIDSYINENEVIHWQVRQQHYIERFQLGDVVYIWRSRGTANQEPAIIARATVVELPRLFETEASADRYQRDGFSDEGFPKIPLRILDSALPNGLTRSELVNSDPNLNNLMILKLKQRTNYIVDNLAQCNSIARLWEEKCRKSATLPTNTESCWILALGQQREDFQRCVDENVISIGWPAIGNLERYSSKSDLEDALNDQYPRSDWGSDRPTNAVFSLWSFCRELKEGDCLYVRDGRRTILGKAIVTGDYQYHSSRSRYPNTRSVRWVAIGEWKLPDGIKTGISTLTGGRLRGHKPIYDIIDRLISGETGITSANTAPAETADNVESIMNDLFYPRELVQDWVRILERKKNLILQGPPGVGKTHIARMLATKILGNADRSAVFVTQFHESYSYEDFVEGLRPGEGEGWEPRDGIFLKAIEFAKKKPAVLIIDEINRGHLSRILGEALMLIEADKRGSKDFEIRRKYSRISETIVVPKDLYIIGTMNTADRSLALVDYALRRRFAFVNLESRVNSAEFKAFLQRKGLTELMIHRIQSNIESINREIFTTRGLGKGFEIGHSYFCNPPEVDSQNESQWLEEVMKYEIRPLLEEYWFDSPEKVENALGQNPVRPQRAA